MEVEAIDPKPGRQQKLKQMGMSAAGTDSPLEPGVIRLIPDLPVQNRGVA